ncbi:hypothetical protein B0H17DRAFT_1218864 [Mycena rosella]|uniref:Uncharacterized protein n=1 Tax=Mycena rosella TaxID=1033263 RepID=A0AAD7BM54_MYCRO|nr:hypothetical protein B0H17DRAFT_1218864 [Mycena rosella]
MNARSKKPRPMKPSIPQEAIDACEASWDAANEKKRKVDPKRYDASGVFVMTCRHSQVLFLCNIDMPGEQQQYIVACLEENSCRIWMIDQYTAFVNEEGRDNLGSWIHRQEHKNLVKKRTVANKVLRDCGVPVAELRRNWEEQKAAQTSIRSYAPMRLKRELDKVLALQTQIDTVEQSIDNVKQSITGPATSAASATFAASAASAALLRSLEKTHETLGSQVQQLYAS